MRIMIAVIYRKTKYKENFMPTKIYIDQGHNPSGFNSGAGGNGYREQDITYRVGILLYDLLSGDPSFTARLSRPTEETVLGTSNMSSLVARVNDANSWGADIFISLHTNAAASSAANGIETLVYDLNSPIASELAEDILESLVEITGFRSRGVKASPGLYVLRKTRMPAVLVEMGFITNPAEAELMAGSPELFARGIYNGILDYYDLR